MSLYKYAPKFKGSAGCDPAHLVEFFFRFRLRVSISGKCSQIARVTMVSEPRGIDAFDAAAFVTSPDATSHFLRQIGVIVFAAGRVPKGRRVPHDSREITQEQRSRLS